MELSPEQLRAIENASRYGLSIITGGPGTGKTAAISRIVDEWMRTDPERRIVCCAPTGQAVQMMQRRLSQDLGPGIYLSTKIAIPDASPSTTTTTTTASTTTMGETPPTIPSHRKNSRGIETATIDALLCRGEGPNGKWRDANMVVDETSMLTFKKAWELCDVLSPHRIVFVGDVMQLKPPDDTESHSLFREMLDSLPARNVVRLTQSFRYSADSKALKLNVELFSRYRRMHDFACDPSFLILLTPKNESREAFVDATMDYVRSRFGARLR